MTEEASLQFRSRKIDEARNYLLDEIKHNYLMSESIKRHVTRGIKKYNYKIFNYKEKEKKKHDKIVLLGKDKLNTIEVLIFKPLIDSYIRHDDIF